MHPFSDSYVKFYHKNVKTLKIIILKELIIHNLSDAAFDNVGGRMKLYFSSRYKSSFLFN